MKPLILAVVLALTPATALGANMKFCISTETIYTDSGLAGEDYWTTASPNAVWRVLTGGAVEIWSGGAKRWDSELGDSFGAGDEGRGCTGWFYVPTANTTYTIYVESKGVVNGWELAVRNRQWVSTGLYPYSYVHGGGAGQFNVAVTGLTNTGAMNDAWDLLNIYQAAAYSFYRHGGGMACTQSLEMMIGGTAGPGEDPPATCSACYGAGSEDHACPLEGNGMVFITSSGSQQKKFQITHELGHALFYRFTGKQANSCSFTDGGLDEGTFDDYLCGYADNRVLIPQQFADDGVHSFHTIEWAGCAQYEGFAQFYAADVWNNHNEENCYFKSYKRGPDTDGPGGNPQVSLPNVNCELDSPDPDPPAGILLPRGYMENMCGADASDLAGKGVEIDWVRTYWNVHTEGGGVDFWEMMEWMDDAQSWNSQQPYNFLDDAAQLRNDQLETNWDAAKNFTSLNEGHGINYPGPE